MNCRRCLRAMIRLGIERSRLVWHCIFCDINRVDRSFDGDPGMPLLCHELKLTSVQYP
jgi:hypothetical protein